MSYIKTIATFLTQAFGGNKEAARRAYLTGFVGDPGADADSATRARMWAGGPAALTLNERAEDAERCNLYLCVSLFRPGDDGVVRRRRSHFEAMHFVMVDDVGTGPSAKVDPARVTLPPTWSVETSPNNCQCWYRLRQPIVDSTVAERVIDALIRRGLMADADPGMRGVTRYGRLPFGVNGKAKYRASSGAAGFPVHLLGEREWTDMDRSYTLEQFVRAWGIEDALAAPAPQDIRPALTVTPETEAFNSAVLDALAEWEPAPKAGMPGVYTLARCPFAAKHTAGAGEDGAAIALVGAEDGAGGVYEHPWFRCHHGHGDVDHWRQLLERLDPNNTGVRLEYTRLCAVAEFGTADVQVEANGTLVVEGQQVLRSPPLTVEEMLTRLVYIKSEDAVVDMARPGEPMPMKAAANLFASSVDLMQGARGGITTVPRLTTWRASEHRLTAEAMVWYPGQQMLFDVSYHSEFAPGVLYYNLWRDKDLGAAPKDWSKRVEPIIAHIEYLLPDGLARGVFLDWLAHAAQRPAERPHTHFLMVSEGGAQGIGRGFVGDLLNATFSGVKRASISDIVDSTFNEVFFECLFVIVDEAEEREARARAAAARHLKDSTTKTVGVLNPKYGRKRRALLFSRVLAFSNSMQSLPIDIKDRRWHVAQNPRNPQEEAYYTQLYSLLQDPRVLSSFVAFLRARDLSHYNPFAPALMTDAKMELLEHSSSELALSLLKIKRHYTPDLVVSSELQEVMLGPFMSERQSAIDAQTLRRACDETDISTYPERLKFEGGPVRVRILRNHTKWRKATTEEARAALAVWPREERMKWLAAAKHEQSRPVSAPVPGSTEDADGLFM